MKEYISIAKNVDIAIDEGLKFLGLNREDVDIKILETGGLFKKAKVCLMYEEKQPEVVEPIIETVETNEVEVIQTQEQPKVEEIVDETTEQPTENKEVVEVAEPVVEVKPTREIKVVPPDELKARVEEFLVNLAKNMNMEITVECQINENDLNFNIKGDKVGKLIGYRGETLNAIQTLLGGLKRTGEGRYRLYLDIEGYKSSREQTLIDLANRMADKSEEIERNVHLDPMSAYERRIIHSALQNRTLVETESMGEGENRHVVIKFKR